MMGFPVLARDVRVVVSNASAVPLSSANASLTVWTTRLRLRYANKWSSTYAYLLSVVADASSINAATASV